MPDYSIYVLGEDDITLTGASGLDGVDQGSGVHLTNTPSTITINAANWTEIQITDNDDNFQDSDSSQVLNGAQDVNGTTYASGTEVEAEYRFDVSDGDGNTWTLIAFNVDNSNPQYGTVEGIAVIGGPGGFPPVGVELTIDEAFEGPNFAAATYATPICFAADTPVTTAKGTARIGDVAVGDMVRLHDGRCAPVRWVGHRRVAAEGRFAPVRFAPGAFGARGLVEVSQQHRILISGWQAELYFGEAEVLVPAVALLNDTTVTLRRGGMVEYVHLLFDAHELIETAGLVSESLHPGPVALGTLGRAARDEVLTLFPELIERARPVCRPALRRRDARALAASLRPS